jgi:hypothetical protein
MLNEKIIAVIAVDLTDEENARLAGKTYEFVQQIKQRYPKKAVAALGSAIADLEMWRDDIIDPL